MQAVQVMSVGIVILAMNLPTAFGVGPVGTKAFEKVVLPLASIATVRGPTVVLYVKEEGLETV